MVRLLGATPSGDDGLLLTRQREVSARTLLTVIIVFS